MQCDVFQEWQNIGKIMKKNRFFSSDFLMKQPLLFKLCGEIDADMIRAPLKYYFERSYRCQVMMISSRNVTKHRYFLPLENALQRVL